MRFSHIPVESSTAPRVLRRYRLSLSSLHVSLDLSVCLSASLHLCSLFSLNRLAIIRKCRHPIVFCSFSMPIFPILAKKKAVRHIFPPSN